MLPVDQQPLVSVVVVTYNSAQYVLETLESIKAQTYQHLELIISDDCSKDHTIDLCQQWVAVNQNRFSRAEIISSQNNTGIAPNCNRGVRASKGAWLKLIAGDDILLPNAVEAYMDHSLQKTLNTMWTCRPLLFYQNGHKKDVERDFDDVFKLGNDFFGYILHNPTIAPFLFFSRSLYEEIGGFNESYAFLEDMPFIFSYYKKGYKLEWIDNTLVRYRLHDGCISNNRVPLVFLDSYRRFFYDNLIIYFLKKGFVFTVIWRLSFGFFGRANKLISGLSRVEKSIYRIFFL